MKKLIAFIMTAGMFLASHPALAATYTVDPVHSTIGFKATHLMVSQVEGLFTDYTSDVSFDSKDLAGSKINVTIKTASINTRNDQRDEHLRSADFLDAANQPTITFASKSITGSGENYTLVGDLTIRGVTKELSIPVSILGPVKSPFGFDALGISGSTVINRQDFGVSWNKQLDQGGVVVSDDVRIEFNLEAHSGK